MPFHDSTMLDAAFDATSGFAWNCTISEPDRANYSTTAILQLDVEIFDEDSGLTNRTKTLELRKSTLADQAAGLVVNSVVTIGSRSYRIQQLIAESTYTLTYEVT